MNFRVILLFTLVLLMLGSCKKETPQPIIPEVLVNFSINPNSTEFLELNSPGGWVYLTGGYQGILVYRLTMTDFLAYERTCPYDPEAPGARVEMEASEITCVCPVCQSKYIILDGSPFEGPSPYLLKQYQTRYDGNILYIFN